MRFYRSVALPRRLPPLNSSWLTTPEMHRFRSADKEDWHFARPRRSKHRQSFGEGV